MSVAHGCFSLSAMTRSTSERKKQVFSPDLYLFDALHLDDMADVGGGKPVNLPDLLHGVVAFIVHKVCPAEFVQMEFGVVSAPVFSFWSVSCDGGRMPGVRPASCRTVLPLLQSGASQ